MPLTRDLCSARKMMTTGSVISTEPAISAAQLVVYWPEKLAMPTGSVHLS